MEVDDADEEEEPTPLVARLRSRTKSLVDIAPPPSEPDADDEEEDEEDEEDDDDDGSPGPSSRTRSRDQLIDSGSSGRSLSSARGRIVPRRSAKARAIEVLRAGESPSPGPEGDGMEVDDDDGMEVDSPEEIEVEEGKCRWLRLYIVARRLISLDDSPKTGPLTRSQRRQSASQNSTRSKHTRRISRHSPFTNGTPLTPPPSLPRKPSEEIDIDIADDTVTAQGTARKTRSGKAYGSQSRRRRLRQEALDDPDMEVEEEDEEGEAEEDGEEDEEEMDQEEDDDESVQDFGECFTGERLLMLLRYRPYRCYRCFIDAIIAR